MTQLKNLLEKSVAGEEFIPPGPRLYAAAARRRRRAQLRPVAAGAVTLLAGGAVVGALSGRSGTSDQAATLITNPPSTPACVRADLERMRTNATTDHQSAVVVDIPATPKELMSQGITSGYGWNGVRIVQVLRDNPGNTPPKSFRMWEGVTPETNPGAGRHLMTVWVDATPKTPGGTYGDPIWGFNVMHFPVAGDDAIITCGGGSYRVPLALISSTWLTPEPSADAPVTQWPVRGDLVGDADLMARARRAGGSQTRVIYAGTQPGGETLVVAVGAHELALFRGSAEHPSADWEVFRVTPPRAGWPDVLAIATGQRDPRLLVLAAPGTSTVEVSAQPTIAGGLVVRGPWRQVPAIDGVAALDVTARTAYGIAVRGPAGREAPVVRVLPVAGRESLDPGAGGADSPEERARSFVAQTWAQAATVVDSRQIAAPSGAAIDGRALTGIDVTRLTVDGHPFVHVATDLTDGTSTASEVVVQASLLEGAYVVRAVLVSTDGLGPVLAIPVVPVSGAASGALLAEDGRVLANAVARADGTVVFTTKVAASEASRLRLVDATGVVRAEMPVADPRDQDPLAVHG